MGLYEEAAEVLRESFTIKDDQIQTNLAGHVPASEASFIELLAPETTRGNLSAHSGRQRGKRENHESAACFQHRDDACR